MAAQRPEQLLGPTDAFVGREAELALLEAALARAVAARASLVTLVGEPGIGKTQTVLRFGQIAAAQGALVLWGRCHEGDASPPYGPWIEALGALPDVPPAAPLRPEDERLRLYEAAAQSLLAMAAEQPTVLVLDDLHWADRDSLGLLRHLGRLLGRARLLVVGTYRDVDVDRRHPLDEVLAALRREVDLERIPIRGLSLEQVAAYLARTAGEQLPLALVRAIHEETGGSPFYVRELFRHLVEEGKIVRRDGRWSTDFSIGELGIPDGVRQLVGRRVSRLSAETGRMLQTAAAFTGGFPFAFLPPLTRLDEEALLDCVDEALAAGLIRTTRGETYDFAHAIVRHTLYEGMNASRRARLHRRIAETIEQVHAGREEEHAGEIAAQYHASATLPGAERGVDHALAAADQARAASAHDRTVVYLRMARDLAARQPATTRAQVLRRLALAEADAVLLDAAPRTLEEALSAGQELGADGREVAAFLADVARALKDGGADHTIWEPMVERGLALLGPEQSLVWARLTLLRDRYETIASGTLNVGRWLGCDRAAVAIARRSGDEDDHARTFEPLEPRGRAETTAILALVEGWRSPGAIIRGLDVVARDWQYRHGDWRRALAANEALLATAERFGSVPGQAEALAQLTGLRAILGDVAGAARTRGQAREMVARLGPVHRLHFVLEVGEAAVLAYYTDGDWPAIGQRAAAFAASPDAARSPLGLTAAAFAALARARCGDASEAGRQLAQIVPIAERLDPRTYMWNGVVNISATAVWELSAADLGRPFLALAERVIETGVSPGPLGSNELTLARMISLVEGPAAATTAFARARATLEADGRLPLRAIVDHDEGLGLLRAGSPDRARAAALLDEAIAGFTALGMSDWIARAREVGAQASARDAASSSRHGLTPREAEVLRLLADGLSNREIAERLVISVRTAEHHLANAYGKIGARGRSEALAYALRHAIDG